MAFGQTALPERMAEKVKQRAEQRAEEAMDKSIDKAEEGIRNEAKKDKKDKKEKQEKEPQSAAAAPASQGFQSYSRYDFIPGENIVYAEDFAQDVIGEFPLKWATNNRGEVVTIGGMEGKWLRMFHNSHFVTPQLKKLPVDFTLEFDAVFQFTDEGYAYPEFMLRMFESLPGDASGSAYLENNDAARMGHFLEARISPDEESNTKVTLESSSKGTAYFHINDKAYPAFDKYFGKKVHFSCWIQKQRLRLWIEGEKVFDIPQAVPPGAVFNRMAISIPNSVQDPEALGFYMTNIVFAEGAPDMRSKLITEGKLVTHGILFDSGSDVIKPGSYPVLKEIAAILQAHPDVKVRITGHTDSDGDDAANMRLSARRSAAVSKALATTFGISADRMGTDGKGESEPAAGNDTPEGKATNRRVVFTKQ